MFRCCAVWVFGTSSHIAFSKNVHRRPKARVWWGHFHIVGFFARVYFLVTILCSRVTTCSCMPRNARVSEQGECNDRQEA